MSHFAQIDENNTVIQVLVIEQEVIDTGLFGDPATWIKTSYNTRGCIHYGEDGLPDGGEPLRKNYAGIRYTYDPILDAFYPPKPYDSWILNTDTCLWEAPIIMPQDENIYIWNENMKEWQVNNLGSSPIT